MPVRKAMRELTATEFHRTLEVMRREELAQRVEHLYYAQLASLLACVPSLVWGKEPPKEFLKIDTWMFDLTSTPEEREQKAKELQDQREREAAEHSVAVWGMVAEHVAGAAEARERNETPVLSHQDDATAASLVPEGFPPTRAKEARQTHVKAKRQPRRVAVRGVDLQG